MFVTVACGRSSVWFIRKTKEYTGKQFIIVESKGDPAWKYLYYQLLQHMAMLLGHACYLNNTGCAHNCDSDFATLPWSEGSRSQTTLSMISTLTTLRMATSPTTLCTAASQAVSSTATLLTTSHSAGAPTTLLATSTSTLCTANSLTASSTAGAQTTSQTATSPVSLCAATSMTPLQKAPESTTSGTAVAPTASQLATPPTPVSKTFAMTTRYADSSLTVSECEEKTLDDNFETDILEHCMACSASDDSIFVSIDWSTSGLWDVSLIQSCTDNPTTPGTATSPRTLCTAGSLTASDLAGTLMTLCWQISCTHGDRLDEDNNPVRMGRWTPSS
eukprot:TRINITY_DN43881_c0_g1_i1.p1 TRINITY_DN43881_c0_g1~~TRINITY_DN43881_c0_g1_i1.p1  ORF type:complete len:343 (-),score=21.20 TRINITY_DN43881_c0_g1_i1:301-1296(-)